MDSTKVDIPPERYLEVFDSTVTAGYDFVEPIQKLRKVWKILKDPSRHRMPKRVRLLFDDLTGIQLVTDISASSPHHFIVFCRIFANFWRKIKVDSLARQSSVVVTQR